LPFKFDGEPPEDSAFKRWNEISVRASQVGGRPWDNTINYPRWMREVGFEDVTEKWIFAPTGPWAEGSDAAAKRMRQLGAWQRENMLQGLEGMTIKNLSRIGWQPDESKVLVAKCREELMAIEPGGKVRPYAHILAVWGRKPTA
jgi:hypothetical protein